MTSSLLPTFRISSTTPLDSLRTTTNRSSSPGHTKGTRHARLTSSSTARHSAVLISTCIISARINKTSLIAAACSHESAARSSASSSRMCRRMSASSCRRFEIAFRSRLLVEGDELPVDYASEETTSRAPMKASAVQAIEGRMMSVAESPVDTSALRWRGEVSCDRSWSKP
ncbi:hypothetical protein BDZ89DRAFT_1042839 [Hymenopellis radicata]|nr:hypothetical protein BDZ89DRAFT_1042839 [Hymenopellis radicata]